MQAVVDELAPVANAARIWRRWVVGRVDHQRVIERIVAESSWTGRYLFMVAMSAGIAVLGLLLSSPAVVIGAMLISPLMSPILGLGFSLTLFDFAEMRRSLLALTLGFTALIVLASPLKAPTVEILARTRPNLFDLLVALFAALAGSYAIIRGRGETIVGVAIATALMPPLAVAGYGLATWNMAVLGGSLALFVTNFVTIALSATIMARIYGFGHQLSAQQTWAQTGLLLLAFVGMAVPLGYSLVGIAREALTTTQVRTLLSDRFGPRSRVTQLAIDFDAEPIVVHAVVIAPRVQGGDPAAITKLLRTELARPVTLQLDQVLLQPGATSLDAQRTELQQAKEVAAEADRQSHDLAQMIALAAGIAPDAVTLDREHHRASAAAVALPGAGLRSYRSLEARVAAAMPGWDVAIIPPAQPLPLITFEGDAATLDGVPRAVVELSAWAAKRWNIAVLAIPGLPDGMPRRPTLAQRRGLAIMEALHAYGVRGIAASPQGMSFRLVTATAEADEAAPAK